MKKINNNQPDDKLRELISVSKLKAGENLKYRIMQQIETEKALSRKNRVSGFSVGSILSIFGAMYAFIVFVAIWLYLVEGKEGLTSSNFYMPVLLISFIGGMFLMVSNMDYYLLNKQKSKKATTEKNKDTSKF